MANEDHINISLFFQGKQTESVDLRIPINITVTQLLKEINTIFKRSNKVLLKQIKISNKGILLTGQQKLKDYPVVNGDLIEILEENNYGGK